MRVLDLFAGTGSATQAFADHGHEVVRVERDHRFEAEIHADVLTLSSLWRPGPWDFIWASPPCTSFSVGSFRHHWRATCMCRKCGGTLYRASGEEWRHVDEFRAAGLCRGAPRPVGDVTYEPKSDTGQLGRALLARTLEIIEVLKPRWWIIENPRALMRKMPELQGVERRTITHCLYGDPRRMKPTDLFGVFPDGFEARACKNGDPCHEAAPRGARTGTQGLKSTEAAMLPPLLGRELLQAMEAELATAGVHSGDQG